MTDTDPARKHLPKPKTAQDKARHGTFTQIAYFTAWATAVLGTLLGIALIAIATQTQSFYGGPDLMSLASGVATIIGSWIAASGVGTLAEISRKLTQGAV